MGSFADGARDPFLRTQYPDADAMPASIYVDGLAPAYGGRGF